MPSQTTKIYDQCLVGLDRDAHYIDNCGGTRSGKTFSVLQVLCTLCLRVDYKPTLTSVVSESVPHLKRGAIKDFKSIMESASLWNEERWNRTDKIYTFPNGSQIEFFSADTQGKVHGASRDRLFINEAQNIPYEIARQLFVRTSGVIFIDYNPTCEFWVHKHIKGSGKEYTINSTYKDNPYLSPEQVEEIESNKGDSEWWNVYGLGLTGHKQGLVFQNWEQIDTIPSDAKFIGRGMDFGFTNDPTAVIDVYLHNGMLLLDERLYETRLTNDVIAKRLKGLDVKGRVRGEVKVIADSAEEKSIEEIRRNGIRGIEPAKKGAGSVNLGLDLMRRFPIRVTKESVNLIRELRNYMWKIDKSTGQTTNEPIDKFNHAIDAVRYTVLNLMARHTSHSRGARFNALEIV